jgi:hypothetical protein
MHLRDEFGSSEVYQLTPKSLDQTKSESPTLYRLGRLFPGKSVIRDNLVSAVENGAVIKKRC